MSRISAAGYKTSTDWHNRRSFEALGSLVLWSLDSVLADLVYPARAAVGSKKAIQQEPPKY